MSAYHLLIFCLIYQLSPLLLVTSFPANYPIAYNQQSLAAAHDINSLESDHLQQAMVDVAATIAEVQKILETDPTLPRLTRGEIEELFETVTREEYERSLRNGDNNRAKHMRALMLVLPYNTNNYSDARLQELYTRPPVTKVINTESKTNRPTNNAVKSEKNDNPNITSFTSKPTTRRKSNYQKPTTFHPIPTNNRQVNSTSSKTVATMLVVAQSTEIPKTYIEKEQKPINHYRVEKPPFLNIQKQPKRDNVKDLLATIGLTQELLPTTTKKPELTPELRELLQSFGLLTNEEPPEHLKYDVEPVQEEFKPFISSATLDPVILDDTQTIPTSNKTIRYRMNTAPEVTADDFSAFNPLPVPEDKEITSEMETFLKSFGLFDGNARGKKSMNENLSTTTTAKPNINKIEEMPEVSVDFLTPDLMNVLGNIGISNKNNEKLAESHRFSKQVDDEETTTVISSDDDDYKKLHLLLETIQQLDLLNKNLTESDIESLNLTKFNFSDSLLTQEGPDPISGSEYEEVYKNEIKRQSEETTESLNPLRFTLDLQATTEESSAISSASKEVIQINSSNAPTDDITSEKNSKENLPISTPSSVPAILTTEAPRSNSGFEDSFAGGLDPITEIPLPPPRRNGFYFLADWNSFLEVGEDPDKVVVRFDPKIGDPSRFLPVNIP